MTNEIQWKPQEAVALQPVVICVVGGTVLAIVLYCWVLATGQTFGQRAAKKYPYGSQEWEAEVQRLYHGESR